MKALLVLLVAYATARAGERSFDPFMRGSDPFAVSAKAKTACGIADCDCGCATGQQCLCIKAKVSYRDARDKAIAEKAPLVVFVHCPAKPTLLRELEQEGYVYCQVDSFAGVPAGKSRVVVGVPVGDNLQRVDLPEMPGHVTWIGEAIRQFHLRHTAPVRTSTWGMAAPAYSSGACAT